jgi:hypothetical protein
MKHIKIQHTSNTMFYVVGAAKVSALQMLQEDWSHPITSNLALYSCHMYLKNPGPWEDPTVTEEPGDDEEVYANRT